MTMSPIHAMTNSTLGLVLAGGKSRRMGSDKALMVRDGESQLSRSVSLLQRHVSGVYVSARRDQAEDPERSRYSLIFDGYDDMGPVAGILSAMDFKPNATWLVLACDLPNVDDETVAKLIGAHTPEIPFTAYKSSHDGLPEPLCAMFSPMAREVIDAFVNDGLVCPRKMLIRSATRLLDLPKSAALDNMNTPADLENTGVRIAS